MKLFRRPFSLITRLTLSIGISVAVIVSLFCVCIFYSMENHFLEQDFAEINASHEAIKHLVNQTPENQSIYNRIDRVALHFNNLCIYLQTTEGQIIYQSQKADLSSALNTLPITREPLTANMLELWQEPQSDHTYRAVQTKLEAKTAQGEPINYQLILANNIDFHRRYTQHLVNSIKLVLTLVIFLILAIIYIEVYREHAPLRCISKEIKSITTRKLNTRLNPELYPQELSDLIHSFNQMIRNIEEVFQRQINFSTDIAHELRTPLATLSTHTQVMLAQTRTAEEYQEVLYCNLEEYERLSKMIADMLFLAQTDNKLLQLELETVDLKETTLALCNFFEALAEDQNKILKINGESILIQGDKGMIRRALSNLISNAIRHSIPQQEIVVSILEKDNFAQISVTNTGQKIPEEQQAYLFDRFYQIDPARKRTHEGCGIGLSIVKSIMEIHCGTVSLQSNDTHTTFTLKFPHTTSKST